MINSPDYASFYPTGLVPIPEEEIEAIFEERRQAMLEAWGRQKFFGIGLKNAWADRRTARDVPHNYQHAKKGG